MSSNVSTRERENGASAEQHAFRQIDDDAYELRVEEAGAPFITMTVDRLRREAGALTGELAVRCDLPGALTYEGTLSVGNLNLSSQRAKTDLATYLQQRSRAGEIDWRGLVDELAIRVLAAERNGQPWVDLRTIPKSAPDDLLEVDGLALPRRHPSITFGDGGTAKSLLALYFLGSLAKRGLRVGLFDWELAGEDHRVRLERLFGPDMPPIAYVRCERPLVYEVDRLRRFKRDLSLDYAGYDSIAFACDGPPEAAEVAGRYFRAVRQIGVGSLHVAHVSKADGSDLKPFGSAFWHNGARSTSFVRLAESTPDGSVIHLGLYNRKSNLGPLRSPVGFKITFTDTATSFRRIHLADVPDLAAGLSLPQRIREFLRTGSRTREEIAYEFSEVKAETLRRSLNRAIQTGQLVRFPGPNGEQIGVAQQ